VTINELLGELYGLAVIRRKHVNAVMYVAVRPKMHAR